MPAGPTCPRSSLFLQHPRSSPLLVLGRQRTIVVDLSSDQNRGSLACQRRSWSSLFRLGEGVLGLPFHSTFEHTPWKSYCSSSPFSGDPTGPALFGSYSRIEPRRYLPAPSNGRSSLVRNTIRLRAQSGYLGKFESATVHCQHMAPSSSSTFAGGLWGLLSHCTFRTPGPWTWVALSCWGTKTCWRSLCSRKSSSLAWAWSFPASYQSCCLSRSFSLPALVVLVAVEWYWCENVRSAPRRWYFCCLPSLDPRRLSFASLLVTRN